MATETDPVIVRIIASQKDLEKSLAASVRATERAAQKMEKNLSGIGGGRGGASNVVQFGKSAADATRQASQAAGQLSFQLNDIATSLSGGMSPFQVMMQQGSQVTQVMQQIRAQGGSMGQVVVGAFTSMLNPIALVSFALIALAGYAVQYFTEVDEGSKEAEKRHKAESDLLDRVAQKWGDLVPRIKEAAEARREALEAGERKEATELVIAESYAKLEPVLKPVKEGLQDVNAEMARSVAQTDEQKAARQELADAEAGLNEAMEKHLVTGAEIERLQAAIGAVVDLTSDEYIDLADALEVARKAATRQAQEDAAARKQATKATEENLEAQKKLTEALKKMQEIGKGSLTEAERLVQAYKDALAAAAELTDADARRMAAQGAAADYAAGVARLTDQATDDEIREFVRGRIRGMIEQESGGNANAANPESTARGLGQFIESTWLRLFPKVYPGLAAGRTRAEQLAFRFDPEISRKMTEELAVENVKAMRAAGTIIVDGAVYLAHFLGAEGARKVLQAAPGTAVSELGLGADVMKSNAAVFAKHQTAGSLIEWAAGVEGGTGATKEASKALDDWNKKQAEAIELAKKSAEINADGTRTTNEKAAAIEEEKFFQEGLNAAIAQYGTVSEEQRAQIRATAHELAMMGLKAADSADAVAAAEKQKQDRIRETQQVAQQIAGIAQSALSGFINDLRNGVEAGEAFSNMLDRIIDGLINMAIQSLFSQQALGGVISNFLGAGNPVGAGPWGLSLKSGGTVGMSGARDGRRFSPALWAGAPRFATGGIVGLRPGEVPIIAHRGEVVIPTSSRVGSSTFDRNRGSQTTTVGDVNIDMSATGLVASSTEKGKLFGREVQAAVQVVLVRESRPGGLLRQQGKL